MNIHRGNSYLRFTTSTYSYTPVGRKAKLLISNSSKNRELCWIVLMLLHSWLRAATSSETDFVFCRILGPAYSYTPCEHRRYSAALRASSVRPKRSRSNLRQPCLKASFQTSLDLVIRRLHSRHQPELNTPIPIEIRAFVHSLVCKVVPCFARLWKNSSNFYSVSVLRISGERIFCSASQKLAVIYHIARGFVEAIRKIRHLKRI